MIQKKQNIRTTRRLVFAVGLLFLIGGLPVFAQSVILRLKSGDQISGVIISEITNQMVTISNAWAHTISVPVAEISQCDDAKVSAVLTKVSMPAVQAPAVAPIAPVAPKIAAVLPSSIKPVEKPKGKWNGEVRLGLDTIVSATDQQDYSGHLKLAYERAYDTNPQKYFRNTFNFDAEYQRTDGTESSDHVQANNKGDFDIGAKSYGYVLIGTGYDEIQRINFQYQFGPGVGMHVIKQPNFNLNLESGLDYQVQYRDDNTDLRTISVRLAQDLTWKIDQNLKLVQSFAFYPDAEHFGEFHNSLESTLSYGFWKNLSLNLTALNDYNTEVVSGVNRNRFELRSSIGVTF